MAELSQYKGLPGQIADTAFKDVTSYCAAENVPFGVFVTEANGKVKAGGEGVLRGVSVRQQTNVLGYYPKQTCVGTMQMGRIWVKVKEVEELKKDLPVTYDASTGELSASGKAVANARLVTDAVPSANDTRIAQVDFHASLAAVSMAEGPKGEKGEKGDRGPQGPQGPKGDKGDKGDPA